MVSLCCWRNDMACSVTILRINQLTGVSTCFCGPHWIWSFIQYICNGNWQPFSSFVTGNYCECIFLNQDQHFPITRDIILDYGLAIFLCDKCILCGPTYAFVSYIRMWWILNWIKLIEVFGSMRRLSPNQKISYLFYALHKLWRKNCDFLGRTHASWSYGLMETLLTFFSFLCCSCP